MEKSANREGEQDESSQNDKKMDQLRHFRQENDNYHPSTNPFLFQWSLLMETQFIENAKLVCM